MKRPPFVTNKRLYLGGKRKQRGGFLFHLPIAATIISQLLGGKRRKKRRKRKKW